MVTTLKNSSMIHNSPEIDYRLQREMCKAFQTEIRQMIREIKITPADGLNIEMSVVDRFSSDAVCDVYGCDNIHEVLEYITEDYYTDYDYTPN